MLRTICRPLPRTVASVLAGQMSLAVREREEAMARRREGDGDDESNSRITLAQFMSSYYRHVTV